MRILLPVADGNEEVEFATIFNILARANMEVVVASIEGSIDPVTLQRGCAFFPNACWKTPERPGGMRS